jgi:hypothetical protein
VTNLHHKDLFFYSLFDPELLWVNDDVSAMEFEQFTVELQKVIQGFNSK